WRLVPLNALVGAVLVGVGMLAFAVHALLVLVVLAGPLVAALVHAAVTVVDTGNVTLADGIAGLKQHWRRGVALGAAGAAFALLAGLAIRFYSSAHVWPLAFVALCLYQLVLWTLAVAHPERSLLGAARDAAELVARRPLATLALGLGLLLVNAAGIAAAVMPFLTLTIVYSFVVAAHFVLPRRPEESF